MEIENWELKTENWEQLIMVAVGNGRGAVKGVWMGDMTDQVDGWRALKWKREKLISLNSS